VVEQADGFGDMIGASPAMVRLYDQLARISDTEASVLICGESGTGKELVARSIHRNSQRKNNPFVPVNCVALPETLLESELFGHAKGAFTDASADRKGLFVQAESGTLFMDEIGEMPLSMQPKLLRALEENSIRPVGAEKEVSFDVRLIAATNRDLQSRVEEGAFREDLFYRIHVIQVELPPLRARGTDVLVLAKHFVENFATRFDRQVTGISDQVAEKLLAYSWPGNVRELRNVIERAVALTQFDKIAVDDLPEKIRDYRSSQVFIGGEDPE
jgi:two-component system response regulator HydG